MNKFFGKISKNEEGGTIILLTVLIMGSILAVSLSLGNVVVNGLRVSSNQANATQAYFAAEAGAEMYLYEVRKGTSGTPFNPIPVCNDAEYINSTFDDCDVVPVPTPTPASFPVGASDFSLLYNYSITGTTTLTSLGTFRGTRRSIKITY
ncbi:hypothetical protein C0584_01620 [Candidatus Parcubacteria bacterium]|nr:MAG: hypothetical protein C0584_01620 [Candidatus Parcubacteria bacterium]